MKRFIFVAAAAIALAPSSSLAGIYEALCGGGDCTINVSSQGISSPQGAIPSSRISYWSVNGESSTSVGTGVATTILFGGIGLLGFLAKNHDFDFTVDGYDVDGRKVNMQFKFKNNKPVKRLTQELYRISGLAMGRQRSIAEIKAIESGEAPLNAMEGKVEPELASRKKSKMPDCGRVLRDYNCNYDAYLDANPSVKAWADANPELSAKERARLGAFSQEDISNRKSSSTQSLDRMSTIKNALETDRSINEKSPSTKEDLNIYSSSPRGYSKQSLERNELLENVKYHQRRLLEAQERADELERLGY